MMAMVKSNASGHGLFTVASLLSAKFPTSAKATAGRQVPSSHLWFGVDSITEALGLRKRGIKNKILVLGYTLPSRLAEAEKQKISITVSNFDGLRDFLKLKKRPAFHLKIDTGMHRQGFQAGDMPKLVPLLK